MTDDVPNAAPIPNVFAGIPATLSAEWIETLAASDHLRIERIVSRGHASPDGFWYDQPHDEFVLLLAGAAARREHHEAPVELSAGSWLCIPAHCRHRVEWTTPDEDTVWLAVHDLAASGLARTPHSLVAHDP